MQPDMREALQEKETPFFVFDLDKIRSKCARLLQTLKPDAIVYAVKCNALPGVLRAIGEQCGFELAKRLGIHPDTAPDLIRAAASAGLIPWGLTFHVGSQCADPTNWDKGLRECGRLLEGEG